MKKIFAIVLAAAMLVSVFAVNAFAADLSESVEVGLYIGGWDVDATVTATEYNTEYEIVFEGNKIVGDWIFVKATSADAITGLADGTVVEITSCVVDGKSYAFTAGHSYTFEVGKTYGGENNPGILETSLHFAYNPDDSKLAEIPSKVTDKMVVKFKIVSDAAEAPAAETPAEDNTPAETPAEDNTPAETPAENTAPVQDPTPGANTKPAAAPANTGIVLCVLPMAVAAAAVVVSKRK